MASVKWSLDALKNLENLDLVVAKRVVAKVGWLQENFTNTVPEKLRKDLRDLYKIRVGDYRVIYSLHKDLLIIEAIGHRRDIYK